ncbi:MAG TPA: phage holin family protein [Candidatus Moranbacteria bacterium]|nr:phage holin family protein [Candidatus Moranbacteria bacterium]
MKILIHWLLSALAIMIAAYLLKGITVENSFVALVVAVVLGFLNTVIRPVLLLFTLPINIMTLGLFTLVINAALILAASAFIPGFHADGFGWAIAFSVVLWLVNSVLHRFEPHESRFDQ